MKTRSRRPLRDGPDLLAGGFIRAVELMRDKVASYKKFPFSIPAVGCLNTLALHPKVTFFVGENGSGKSTLIEAIAQAAGFDEQGGSRNFNVRSQFLIATHSPIIMAYPDARIYHLHEGGITSVAYEETEHYRLTRDFLDHRETYLQTLFSDRDFDE